MDTRKENRSSPTYVNVDFLARKTTFPSPTSPLLNGRVNVNHVIKVCEVVFDYDASGDDELSLRRGEKLELLSTDAKISGDEGWWTGKSGDKVGIFPANFVEILENRCRPSIDNHRHAGLHITRIPFNELALEEVIGIGGFGKVYRGI